MEEPRVRKVGGGRGGDRKKKDEVVRVKSSR